MRDANWTPAVEYWKRRSEAADSLITELRQRFAASQVDLAEARAREAAAWQAAAAICDERGLKYPVPSIAATVADDCAEAIRAALTKGSTDGKA